VTPAILVLSPGGLATAGRIRAVLPGAELLGLEGRVTEGIDRPFADMTSTVQALFREGRPIVGLCAAGILIRMIGPLLGAKRQEAPVLAVSEDGAVVVPLVGGLTGANDLAQAIADALGVVPAITGSGARKFGVILERPPEGWRCANPGDAKRITADLLAGAAARVEGALPWLAATRLPLDPAGAVLLRSSIRREPLHARGLLYRPRSVIAAVGGADADVAAALERAGVDPACLVAVVAPAGGAFPARLPAPPRLLDGAAGSPGALALRAAGPGAEMLHEDGAVGLAAAPLPLDPGAIGRPRGRVAVVGLGPGAPEWLTPEARAALEDATDIVGYGTYVDMVPAALRADKALHGSDNRVELERARTAMDLAAAGRLVAIVSSGDPGIFAMAAALMEVIETPGPGWASVDIAILPGISAMQAAAARVGAPLGHDFAVISLSDNLKPWAVILRRIEAALSADLAIAFYNPVSRARPTQLADVMALVARYRDGATPVTLGRDVGRAAEAVTVVGLGAFDAAMADSRTVILVGSSRTRRVRLGGRDFVYTPRSYPDA
jgi:cobalt-precorrin 5A hydrolase/precorrin-3B C17-methyltransferase